MFKKRVNNITLRAGMKTFFSESEREKTELKALNIDVLTELETCYQIEKYKKFPQLTGTDIAVSSLSGIIAFVIDYFLVGTPDIVKIYKGGEKFDGSLLTEAIRKLGDGPFGELGKTLSNICKVPYDISAIEGGMYPQNHRLRSLSHDPLFGLFFAIFDIVMNTTTYIDNAGVLRIIPNIKFKATMSEKILSVLYFIGHIISDMFTARGIPIPGFFITQFFTNAENDNSISEIAENMYLNGYDMRHLASMATPVMVKNLIIDVYMKLMEEDDTSLIAFADKELRELNESLKKVEMKFIADTVMVTGNVVKFFAPPSCGNPCALNAAEWFSFLHSGISVVRAGGRETSAEEALDNRKKIEKMWEELLD